MNDIPTDLRRYIEDEIIPRYDGFDAGHRRDHVEMVIANCLWLSSVYQLNAAMAYTIAACHDIGLVNGREHHHINSARLMRADANLRRWFTVDEVNMMADAAEDHRASAGHEPRTLYGCVVADADHISDPDTVIRRTIQYGLEYYPQLSPAQHRLRCYDHLQEKYAEGGYMHLWLPESSQLPHLSSLRRLMACQSELDVVYERLWHEEIARRAAEDDKMQDK